MNRQFVVLGGQHGNADPIVAAEQAEVGIAQHYFSFPKDLIAFDTVPFRVHAVAEQSVAPKNLHAKNRIQDRSMGFEADHHPELVMGAKIVLRRADAAWNSTSMISIAGSLVAEPNPFRPRFLVFSKFI